MRNAYKIGRVLTEHAQRQRSVARALQAAGAAVSRHCFWRAAAAAENRGKVWPRLPDGGGAGGCQPLARSSFEAGCCASSLDHARAACVALSAASLACANRASSHRRHRRRGFATAAAAATTASSCAWREQGTAMPAATDNVLPAAARGEAAGWSPPPRRRRRELKVHHRRTCAL